MLYHSVTMVWWPNVGATKMATKLGFCWSRQPVGARCCIGYNGSRWPLPLGRGDQVAQCARGLIVQFYQITTELLFIPSHHSILSRSAGINWKLSHLCPLFAMYFQWRISKFELPIYARQLISYSYIFIYSQFDVKWTTDNLYFRFRFCMLSMVISSYLW